MAGTLWTKFFWSDWASDPALRICSLAAQGLWMRMLCIAAEADPTGYVTVNGRSLGVTDIARLAGVTETECEPLLAELERNGVFSRTRQGVIYSRRMVRDAKRSLEGRKSKLDALAANQRRGKEKKSGLKGSLEGVLGGGLTTQKPDAISHKPEAASPKPPSRFDEVEAALRGIEGLSAHPVGADPVIGPIVAIVEQGYDLHTQIIPSIRRQLAKRTGRPISRWSFFVPGICEDAKTPQSSAPPPAAAPAVDWATRLRGARNGRYWSTPKWGPFPHTPGCLVPPELLLPDDGQGWLEYEEYRRRQERCPSA